MLGAPAVGLAQRPASTIGFTADNVPSRTECGIGALMPWADALWAVTYNSHMKTTGTGLGLYRIDEDLADVNRHLGALDVSIVGV